MVNEAFRQALKLQVMFLATRPKKRVPGHSGTADPPKPGDGTKGNWHAGAVESQDTSRVNALGGGRRG
jgi:hypothetical protein